MRRIIRPFVILFSSLILTVSCLSDDSASYIYYSDTAITSFSLGTLNRTMWTKSSTGADSSYVEEIDGSDYHFYIDQAGRRIYNPDSLPVGTDAAHVICNIGSKNGGTVVIAYKDTEGADSLAYYSSSDSIDFSEPLDFRVYANDGMNFRTYKISVNVHKEDPDSFTWQRMDGMASRTFRQFDAMKATTLGGRLIVMGRDGSATRVMISNGGAWTEGASLADGEAWANAVVKGDSLFTYHIKVDDKRFDEVSADSLKAKLSGDLASPDMEKLVRVLSRNGIGLCYKYELEDTVMTVVFTPEEIAPKN